MDEFAFYDKKEVQGGMVTLIAVQGDEDLITLAARQSYGSEDISGKDRIIKHLEKKNHGVPFEYTRLIFKIDAPIFVLRHLYTYRTWTRSEKSLRYVTPENAIFYYPEYKGDVGEEGDRILEVFYYTALQTYERLRDLGYKKEDARIVLPLGLHSEMMAAIDLRNFEHFLRQRLEKSTQPLTRAYAYAMMELVEPSLPLWAKEFRENNKELFT